MSTIVEKGQWILADLTENNNKWYRLTRYDNHSVFAEWGRVGDTGQSQTKQFGSEYEAQRHYQATIKSKEKKGYVRTQTLEGSTATQKVVVKEELKTVALQQIQFTSPLVRDLVTYLSERNVHDILQQTTMTFDASRGTFSTPLGIVTDQAIRNARHMLTQIASRVAGSQWSDPQLTPLVNSYLMLVPQNIGRRRQEARDLFPDLSAIQRQNALLDGLEASLQAVLAAPAGEPTKTSAPVFNVKLERLSSEKEIDRIQKKFKETSQSRHESSRYDLKEIYLIEIAHMKAAFEQDGLKLGNIAELWHGTSCAHVLSILKSGFRIPNDNDPHVTGKMFGRGIYMSDQSTKSLNYATNFWSGGPREGKCFMFLINAGLGRCYTPTGPSQSPPPPGYDSIFAIGGKSGVLNNEFVAPRPSMLDIVFLCEFSPRGR